MAGRPLSTVNFILLVSLTVDQVRLALKADLVAEASTIPQLQVHSPLILNGKLRLYVIVQQD